MIVLKSCVGIRHLEGEAVFLTFLLRLYVTVINYLITDCHFPTFSAVRGIYFGIKYQSMKILSAKAHGILDYTTVLFLALSPSLFKMPSPDSQFTYVLAFIHLCLTLLTSFKLGVYRIIPLRLHGLIEFCVAMVLLIVTLVFNVWKAEVSFYFYTAFSIVLFFVWFFSDYKMSSAARW